MTEHNTNTDSILNEEGVNYIEIVRVVDTFILDLVEKYKIHPLSVSSIILARLLTTNDLMGSGELFRTLVQTVVADTQQTPKEKLHLH
jgi:replication initiation and membrane attachment protein DnaB